MFTECDTAGMIWKTGLRQNGTGWQLFIENHQFPAANQGADFTKIMMKAFATIETNVRQNKQMSEDSEKYHPLSIALKGRYFEHCVVNEREQCPRWMGLNKRGAWWHL